MLGPCPVAIFDWRIKSCIWLNGNSFVPSGREDSFFFCLRSQRSSHHHKPVLNSACINVKIDSLY